MAKRVELGRSSSDFNLTGPWQGRTTGMVRFELSNIVVHMSLWLFNLSE